MSTDKVNNVPSPRSSFNRQTPLDAGLTEIENVNISSTGAKSRFINKDEENTVIDENNNINPNDNTTDESKEKKSSLPYLTQIKLFLYNQLSIHLLHLRTKSKLCNFLLQKYDNLSPSYKKFAICLILLWKCFTTCLTIYLVIYGRSKYLLNKQQQSIENISLQQQQQVVYGSSSNIGEDGVLSINQQQHAEPIQTE